MLLALGAILAANVSAREVKRVVVVHKSKVPCKEFRMREFRGPFARPDFRAVEMRRELPMKFVKGDIRKGDFRKGPKRHHRR